MEYVVGLIAALVAGLLYYRGQAIKSKIDSSLAENRGRDKELVQQENEVKKAISEIDAQIEEIKKQRKEIRQELTEQERADKWK